MRRQTQRPVSLHVHPTGENARSRSGVAGIPDSVAFSAADLTSSGHESGKDRLESWKAIAVYLGREVRTVQRWEKGEGLPVHRHLHSTNGSVYAFRSEIDGWRRSRSLTPEVLPVAEMLSSQPRPARRAAGCLRDDGAENPPSGVRLYLLVCSSDSDFYRVISRIGAGAAKTRRVPQVQVPAGDLRE